MALSKDGRPVSTLKKRHLGLAGLLTVLMQYMIGAKNEAQTQHAFDRAFNAQLRAQSAEIRANQDQFFVRKIELTQLLDRIDAQLDHLEEKIDGQNSQISNIEGYLKSRVKPIEVTNR